MNRDRARKLLPIVQAFVDGKDIQCRYGAVGESWHDILNIGFDDLTEYRVKPEPREVWIDKDADLSEGRLGTYHTSIDKDGLARFVEVLDD